MGDVVEPFVNPNLNSSDGEAFIATSSGDSAGNNVRLFLSSINSTVTAEKFMFDQELNTDLFDYVVGLDGGSAEAFSKSMFFTVSAEEEARDYTTQNMEFLFKPSTNKSSFFSNTLAPGVTDFETVEIEPAGVPSLYSNNSNPTYKSGHPLVEPYLAVSEEFLYLVTRAIFGDYSNSNFFTNSGIVQEKLNGLTDPTSIIKSFNTLFETAEMSSFKSYAEINSALSGSADFIGGKAVMHVVQQLLTHATNRFEDGDLSAYIVPQNEMPAGISVDSNVLKTYYVPVKQDDTIQIVLTIKPSSLQPNNQDIAPRGVNTTIADEYYDNFNTINHIVSNISMKILLSIKFNSP